MKLGNQCLNCTQTLAEDPLPRERKLANRIALEAVVRIQILASRFKITVTEKMLYGDDVAALL